MTKGLYILLIKLKKSQTISAGRLSPRRFRKGRYLYIGKARLGLKARLNRHLRKDKKLFWHIDYLLQKSEIEEIWVNNNFYDECKTASALNRILEPVESIKKFGSSDCNCSSHLICFSGEKDQLKSLRQKLGFKEVLIHENHV